MVLDYGRRRRARAVSVVVSQSCARATIFNFLSGSLEQKHTTHATHLYSLLDRATAYSSNQAGNNNSLSFIRYIPVSILQAKSNSSSNIATLYSLTTQAIINIMGRKHRIDLGFENDDSSSSNRQNKASRMHPADAERNRWTGDLYSARYYSILETRTKLPVYQFKDKLLQTVRDNQIVVVEGETGSGTYGSHIVFLHIFVRRKKCLLPMLSCWW